MTDSATTAIGEVSRSPSYYRARYYNPTTGRFLSEDPIGFAGSGPNLYAYAGDNPISFNDPFGLWDPVSPAHSSPPASCSFPACFWYYGNFGGPGWTGGQWRPWEDLGDPFAPGLPTGMTGPSDAQDACYMQHDRCYAKSRPNGKCSSNKNGSGESTGSCDWQLMQCLGKLPNTDPSAYNPAAAAASQLFWMMSIYKSATTSDGGVAYVPY
jgi:RHS repeat-associated protein